jgi:hypothetical protein
LSILEFGRYLRGVWPHVGAEPLRADRSSGFDRRRQSRDLVRLVRLARTLVVQEAVLGHVWKHTGRVFAVDVGEVLQDDPDDPMRTAIREIMGVFAQRERGADISWSASGRSLSPLIPATGFSSLFP